MKNLAIITARSGSKGLENKNIKRLVNKPLLAYTIEVAKSSQMFDEIMVSTDSDIYEEIAKQWGASVPFLRSKDLSNDTASSWDVVKEVINKYRDIGKEFDTISLLQPTSPLRTADDIIEGYRILEEKSAKSVVAVCEMDHSPLWSNTLLKDHSMVDFISKEIIKTPRQSLPTYYRINGALYILKIDGLVNSEIIYSDKCYATIMTKENSIDIDDKIDFIIAEALMKQRLSVEP